MIISCATFNSASVLTFGGTRGIAALKQRQSQVEGAKPSLADSTGDCRLYNGPSHGKALSVAASTRRDGC